MPATLGRTRRNVDDNTRELGKSLELTIKMKVYDNGMVEVFGEPINSKEEGYDAGHGWLGAAECITLALGEFRRKAVTRRKKLSRDSR
jgi:hypothetical protein